MVRNVKISNIVKINEKNLTKRDNWKYINYLDTSSITEGIIENIQKIDLSQEKVPSRAKRKVEKDDIIISTVRPNLKHYGIIKTPYDNMIVSTGFTVLTPIKEKVNPDYLYNFFRLEEVTNFLSAIAETSTTTYPSITSKVIEDLEISLPALEKQNKIASILSSLDEKIELNRKINQNLEETAQTLFKRWFIDFEFPNEEGKPYKNSGGKMIKSELGEIPEGWRVGSIKEIGNVVTGKTPNTKIKKYYNGIIPFITIPDIHNKIYITKTERTLSELGNNCQKEKILPQNTIVVSCIATVGLVGITTRPSQTNQQINAIILNNEETLFYFFNYLKRIKTKLILIGSSGTATLNINKSIFEKIEIIIPKLEIMINFNKKLKNIYLKIKLLQEETEKLIEVRDYLLPKLMNGEIDVSNLKIFEILNSDKSK